MNPEIKKLWTDALRSGEYAQGHSVLSKQNVHTGEMQHCCLGVLCDLAVKAGVIEARPEATPEGRRTRQMIYDREQVAYLPQKVAEWAGLLGNRSPLDPEVGWGSSVQRLSELNDGERLSFLKIADIIEQRL